MDKRGIVSMNKKTVILATIITIAIGLVICSIFVIWLAKNSKNNQSAAITTKKIDHAKMVADYQASIKPVLEEYEQIVGAIDSIDSVSDNEKQNNIVQIQSLKNKLTEIIVPAEYQDMHIKILFGLISLENYISKDSDDEKIKAESALNEVIEDNKWLNK